jgi:hypothetical protein
MGVISGINKEIEYYFKYGQNIYYGIISRKNIS